MRGVYARQNRAAAGGEAATMRRSAAILRDLADAVSRGRLDAVDVPEQLRRTAADLEEGAQSVQQLREANETQGDPRSFLQNVAGEVQRLDLLVQDRLHSAPNLRAADDAARLRKMTYLLRMLAEICSGPAAGRPGTYVGMLSPSSAAANFC